jgi:aldehyde:ferredoxin oxidoreductase
MARGEGFGMIVGQGIRYMKQVLRRALWRRSGLLQDIGTEIKGLEMSII